MADLTARNPRSAASFLASIAVLISALIVISNDMVMYFSMMNYN
jgi:hypothetical protein